MNDKEMLELAAKAVEVEIEWEYDKYARVKGEKRYWNPLTDDGDALRLAVKLGIDVLITAKTETIIGSTSTFGPFNREEGIDSPRFDEDHKKDPYAATRRAITRAAAEIGKSMP